MLGDPGGRQMSARGLKKNVRKGDCYSANFGLLREMIVAGEDAYLVHGIVQAADYYKHMKPGTLFMHCWVEARHPEHGWKVGDNSLGELTFHPKKMFYDGMKPRAVVRMNIVEAQMHALRYKRYGGWNLHPEHKWFQ